MAPLTTAEYKVFQQFSSSSLEPLPIEQLEGVRFIALDNLITRDKRQWGVDILQQGATDTLGLVGKPFTLNHDWYAVELIQGTILSAKLYTLDSAPKRFIDTVESKSNRKILTNEGYSALTVKVAFNSYNPIVGSIAAGFQKYVSFGGLPSDMRLICPHDGLDFEDPECKYLPPCRWWDYDDDYLDRTGYKVADYATYKGTVTFTELSNVMAPNLPGAQIIDRSIEKFFPE